MTAVPLDRLRAMPPVGAPCIKTPEGAGIPSMIRDGEALLFVRGEQRGETGASWAVVLHGDTVEWLPARAVALDLSAPTLRDGLPVRLDALPWGLRVLHPEATGARMGDMPNRAYLTCDAKHALSALVYDGSEWSPHPFKIILNPWPDLSDLKPDDASRAVVVAALKARKVKP